MKKLRFPIASAIVAVGMLASPSLAHSPIPSFRSAEIHYRDESSIDKMRSALTAAIPPGTPVADATAMLTHARLRPELVVRSPLPALVCCASASGIRSRLAPLGGFRLAVAPYPARRPSDRGV